MPALSWPTVVAFVGSLVTVAALGATHVVSADWTERTITMILGFVVGHSVGVLRSRQP